MSPARQQEKQKEEAQPVVILSDYSSDEASLVPTPWPALLHPVPMSCSESQAEGTSNPVPEAHANPTGEESSVPSTTPTPTVDMEDSGGVPEATREEDNSNNSAKPPAVELSSDIVAQITPKECALDDNCCHHKDWAGKRCCNPALEGKRLCKCHYSDTLKLQEALGLLISSKPSQEGLDSGKNAPQASLKTEPVSPVTDHASAEVEPISLVTENQPTVKVEPPSPPEIKPPQHSESVIVLQQEKPEQTVCAPPTETMQQTTGEVIKMSTLQQSSESVGKSGYVDQQGMSQLDKLNAKEQEVVRATSPVCATSPSLLLLCVLLALLCYSCVCY